MSTFQIVLVFVGGAILLSAANPNVRRFFKNLFDWGGAQAGRGADAVANADPLGVYKSKIENAVEKSKNANRVVSQAAQTLTSLRRQIADDEKEQVRLANRIKAVLANGDPNNSATTYALELERVESNLTSNRAQEQVAKAQYDENLALVTRYEQDLSDARKDAQRLGFQLAQSQAEKDLVQMNADLRSKLNLGELGEARQRVQSQIDANRGDSQAARDLSKGVFAEQADEELERQQRAKDVLARFQTPAATSSNAS